MLNPFDQENSDAAIEGRVALDVLPELKRQTTVLSPPKRDWKKIVLALGIGIVTGAAFFAALYSLLF